MKVLLIRSPRLRWHLMTEFESFHLPQGLLYLATVLRENDVNVEVIDCCAEQIGWKSLEKLVKKRKPDVVGAGSETCYAHEDGRLFEMTKRIDSEVITVAGGVHHSHMVEDSLNKWPIDFIVRWEGEYTFLELIKKLEDGGKQNFKKIKGIAYKDKSGRTIKTKPRQLIENLDELPFPAFDLMPMDMYVRHGRQEVITFPRITIHHSRGCIGGCDFCSCWPQMAEHKPCGNNLISNPTWRTKSVEKTIEEMEYLYRKHKVRFFHFTDDTWNIDPNWNREFAEELLERGLELYWHIRARADFLVRDEKLGILKKMVGTGLKQVYVGVERESDKEVKSFHKKNYSRSLSLACFQMLRKKYPKVIRAVTLIVGVPEETKKSMLDQLRFALELDADTAGFMFATPFPGTRLWKIANEKKLIRTYDFKKYDFISEPILHTKYLTANELVKLRRYITIMFYLKEAIKQTKNLLHSDLLKIKALGYRYLLKSGIHSLITKSIMNPFLSRALFPKLFYNPEDEVMRRKPKWYDR